MDSCGPETRAARACVASMHRQRRRMVRRTCRVSRLPGTVVHRSRSTPTDRSWTNRPDSTNRAKAFVRYVYAAAPTAPLHAVARWRGRWVRMMACTLSRAFKKMRRATRSIRRYGTIGSRSGCNEFASTVRVGYAPTSRPRAVRRISTMPITSVCKRYACRAACAAFGDGANLGR